MCLLLAGGCEGAAQHTWLHGAGRSVCRHSPIRCHRNHWSSRRGRRPLLAGGRRLLKCEGGRSGAGRAGHKTEQGRASERVVRCGRGQQQPTAGSKWSERTARGQMERVVPVLLVETERWVGGGHQHRRAGRGLSRARCETYLKAGRAIPAGWSVVVELTLAEPVPPWRPAQCLLDEVREWLRLLTLRRLHCCLLGRA